MSSVSTKQLKERILLLTFIYRSLPTIYLTTIARNDEEKKQIHWTLNNLIAWGFVLSKKSKPIEHTFIHLSVKGYKYVTDSIFNGSLKLMYQHKTSRSLLKPVSNHSFLSFAYLWHFHNDYPDKFAKEIQLYEYSDINNCKILFSYKGNNNLISPDVIIYTSDPNDSSLKQAIFVENDTGRETYEVIFHKIIDYFALAEEGMDIHKISSIALYFTFLSKRRLEQLFYSPTGFLRFFELYNKTNRGVEVRMKSIIKTLKEKPFKIFLSDYDYANLNKPFTFQQYDLLPLLLKKEDSWDIFR